MRKLAFFLFAFAALLCLLPVVRADEKENDYGTVIGIDLGTTYSCVAVQKNGQVEIIANAQVNGITPSWVGFTDDERLIGDAAKNQAPQNPENTVFDAKRLIGRTYSDGDVKKDIAHFPFKIVNKGGKPMIQVSHRDELKDFVSHNFVYANVDSRRNLGHDSDQNERDCRGVPWSQGYPRRRHCASL